MSGSTPPTTVGELLSLAHRHGLALSEEGARLDTMGLDSVVLHAADADGTRWIVRAPRRPDVVATAVSEGRVLAAVRPHLPVAVPDWRVHSEELIAYPRLAGTPAVTLDTGAPIWNIIDPAAPSEPFLESFAAALAALQAVPPVELPPDRVDAPGAGRARLIEAVQLARGLLAPSEATWARWQRFLDGDTWPDHAAVSHGDLHPGHLLLDEGGRLTGVIDWTEARAGDPGVDLAMFAGCFGRAALERLLPLFERHGGRTWPRLIDHALERWALGPALAAEWAQRTGSETVMQYARDQLAAQADERV